MTAFTRLGASIWDWPPFIELDDPTRILWLALYTTSEAKRHAPGLWQGGIPTMADASRQRADVVVDALDRLLERELVEYDSKTRVARLCMLPDAGEYPSNGKVILSWWTRFKSVPECGVRDAHIPTLRWIIDAGARQSGKGVTEHHETAWRETFGKVTVPAPRHRGLRRLTDSDTGTAIQPSLFSGSDPGNGIPAAHESRYPQTPQPSVDNSASLRQLNKNNSPETVSDTVSDTNRIPDPGSRIPDLSSLSGEGGRGGGHETGKPILTLVPPFTAAEVFRELAQGRWDESGEKAYQEAVGALIPAWAASGVVLADFALLAQYNALKQRTWSPRHLVGCDIHAEVSCAKRTMDWHEVQMTVLRKQL